MSLVIAFKGPEGIVLAADSRVSLTAEMAGGQQVTATYDNATKLFGVASQTHVGVVTYGVGAFGARAPRTVNSFLPELEDSFEKKAKEATDGVERLSVQDFAEHLGQFFLERWTETMPEGAEGSIHFLVGGYDEGELYGRVFRLAIPGQPTPDEQNAGTGEPGSFGVTWGGQLELTSRLVNGFDPQLIQRTKDFLDLTDEQSQDLHQHLKENLSLPIPYQFLPLQDCVDLSENLVKTTIGLQGFLVGNRGVGGPVDVAVVSRKLGFRTVRQKRVASDVENS